MQATKSARLESIRKAASGQWSFIVSTISRIPAGLLDGKHHPCPSGKCRSQMDAFRVFDDFEKTGGTVCNQCGKHGDGFATLQWLTGRSFPEVVELVGSLLCVDPDTGKKSADPAYHLRWVDWNESLVALWCMKYKPVIPEAIKLVGGRMAIYRGKYTVIAVSVWLGARTNIVGWRIWNIRGKLPKFSKDGNKKIEWVKSKLTYGSQPGLVGSLPPKATEAWKVEGETDCMALLSVNPRAAVICNSSGAGESPAKFNWLKDSLVKYGKFFVIHDADQPGQDGAERWSKHFAAILGDKVRVANIELPYPIQPSKGKDLRDWLAEGNRYDTLIQRAGKFDSTQTTDSLQPTEAEDDPHRLAKVNLDQYERDHDGRLVYWRDEWWKYKRGCYRKIDSGELRAKVTASIRTEFVRCWRERQKKGGDEAKQPVRKVTKPLVGNVVGAMESMVARSSRISMPCWLPDRGTRNYLSMANGILDLDALFADKDASECLLPHSPHWFSSFRLEYEFNPDAKCPRWLESQEFISGGDEEKKRLMQEWAGYCLLPTSNEQKFFVFEGEGNNGKSSFFAGIEAMIGSENTSSLSLEDFKETFAMSTTVGKAVNIAGDVGKIEGGEEAILKRYTGGEALQIRRMYLPPLTIRPTAKLMMAWNERPRFQDKSEGLWRRMILVPLNQTILKHKRIKGMDKPTYWEQEAPGIMIWALVGLARLLQQGDFSNCGTANEALNEYKIDSNPVAQFFCDYVEERQSSYIESRILYQVYRHWCEQEGFKPMSDRSFGKQIKKIFKKCERKKFKVSQKLSWRYEGIGWQTNEILGMEVSSNEIF
jgi:P4 family phage/plasmid primase-like protien